MADVVKKATRQGYGEELIELCKKHSEVISVDADLANANGTLKLHTECPDQFVEVGIAEQNLIGVAAGLARVGFVPFANSFAIFTAGRAYEIIRNSVCYSNINVKVVGSHCGITPAGDGGTHQCIEDIAAMRALPNMTVLQPCDYNQAKLLTDLMYEHKGPCYMRTSREPMPLVTSLDDKIEIGKAQIIKEGKDLCIVATGVFTPLSMPAIEKLEAEGYSVELINIHTIKPLDVDTIKAEVKKCGGKVLVCEEANMYGGLGEAICYAFVGEAGIKFGHVAVNDRFGQSGLSAELLEEYGITSDNVYNHAKELLK